MSVVFTGTNQGRFTSTGVPVTINLRSDLDWMNVYNYTQMIDAGVGANQAVQCYWQRGMPQGGGIKYIRVTGESQINTAEITAGTGFYLVDSSVNVPGALQTLTAISADAIPRVATAATAVVNTGDIVRIYNTVDAEQLAPLDFTVGSISAGVYFQLAYMAQIAAGTTGTWRRIPFDPLYYPRSRYITKITQAAQAVVTLSVTHGYTIGQEVRFVIPFVRSADGADPAVYGMTELDGLQGSIVDINKTNNTITVDIDTTGFTAFAFPLTADAGFTPAQVIPIGENTATALNAIPSANILDDATYNTGYLGIQLKAGAGSPAGVNNDVIYWVAGKSFSVDNR